MNYRYCGRPITRLSDSTERFRGIDVKFVHTNGGTRITCNYDYDKVVYPLPLNQVAAPFIFNDYLKELEIAENNHLVQ